MTIFNLMLHTTTILSQLEVQGVVARLDLRNVDPYIELRVLVEIYRNCLEPNRQVPPEFV